MATTSVCAADAARAISSPELELAVSWIALETRIECEEGREEIDGVGHLDF
jgi:hypothetical protein